MLGRLRYALRSRASITASKPFYRPLPVQRKLLVPAPLSARRTFSTEAETKPFANVSDFHEASNDALNHLLEKCDHLPTLTEIPGFDLKESSGVLEINLGAKGVYVINKQTPNQQIWFSSPISGPKRFNYDPETETWVNTRNGEPLFDLLSSEINKLLGISTFQL